MTAPDTRFNQSVAKAFEVLEAFGAGPGVLSLAELMELSGLDKNSTQRMLHTLVELGYVERGPGQRGYALGKKILARTFDYLRGSPLLERATPVLIDLQQECGERVDLSLFDDLDIVYAVRRLSKRQTYFATLIGRRMPVFCSSGGRAIMSRLSDEGVDDILARSSLEPLTRFTVTDPDAIRELVAKARVDGYAMAPQECWVGEVVLASPIVDHNGEPVAAIHISGLLSEWTPERFAERFSSLALTAARALSGKRS